MDIIRSVLDNLGFDAAVFCSQLVLFYILHLLLTPLIYKPLEKVRRERESLTDERVREAQQFKNKAAKLKAQYEQAIHETQNATLAITQKAHQEAEASRQAVLDAARNEANSIIADTRAEMAKDRRLARQTLEAEVPALAKAVACKLAQAFTSGEVGEQFLKRLRSIS